MAWIVLFSPEFDKEFSALDELTQDDLLAAVNALKALGPKLGRPAADTLSGSKYPNMKELRVRSGKGVWRVAYAFDPERKAIVLCAGNKTGIAQRRFYTRLIGTADDRFRRHLQTLGGSDEKS